MTPNQLRQKYLDFFADKIRKHKIIPSAPLVPENDSTTLFTSSGMQPLVPYLLGQTHPKGDRLVDSQKCFRAVDIEEVGDNRHTTFFEMLGNWSLGSYTKKDQINWLWEFLTVELRLPKEKLQVSIFEGNDLVPKDTEAEKIWLDLALPEKHIHAYSAEKNWWSRSGAPAQMPVGEPGGPSSEIFYDFGTELKLHEKSVWKDEECHPNCDCGRFMEIGNSVFMSYKKTADGVEKLSQENIDFGGGFERILAAMQDEQDVFKTDLFAPIIKKLEELSNKKYSENFESFRIIADHLKAAVMLAADAVYPSNKAQGYFSRRLLRRAIRHGKNLGIAKEFVSDLVDVVFEIYGQVYPKNKEERIEIKNALQEEEKKFLKTLEKGLRKFEEIPSSEGQAEGRGILSAEQAFKLHETHGFPLDLSIEEAENKNIKVEKNIKNKFEKLRQEHAEKSRTASVGMFKGGLANAGEITVKYHTATHLLHAALRKILGNHVKQKGSNITAKRLRFDFAHPQALTQEEKEQVEEQVNTWIKASLPVSKKNMNKQKALEQGALAFFAEKYPDEVSVYVIGPADGPPSHEASEGRDWISHELCGGPHVKNTGEIGEIKISKEKAVGTGMRRVYMELI
ncbi:MAG: alanine--tRNA ligase [Patescibacteria group bacterium]